MYKIEKKGWPGGATKRERERERDTHTHTHARTHAEREREREREREEKSEKPGPLEEVGWEVGGGSISVRHKYSMGARYIRAAF